MSESFLKEEIARGCTSLVLKKHYVVIVGRRSEEKEVEPAREGRQHDEAPVDSSWQVIERAVLGGVLLDPTLLPMVSRRLRPSVFHLKRHQVLFGAMLDLHAEESEITLRNLQAKLRQRAQLDTVGGFAYVASLDLDLPDIARVSEYVEVILDRATCRRSSQR